MMSDLGLLIISLNNPSREAKDYMKAVYGFIAMIHTIAADLSLADSESFKELKVVLVQASSFQIMQRFKHQEETFSDSPPSSGFQAKESRDLH